MTEPNIVQPAELLQRAQASTSVSRLAETIGRQIDPGGTPYAKMRLGYVTAFDSATWTCTALIGDLLTPIPNIPVLGNVLPAIEAAGLFAQTGGDRTTEYTLVGMLPKDPGTPTYGQVWRIRKPSAETITNASSNDDDHLRFYGQAGRTYLFEALLIAQQNTGTDMDIKVGWSMPSGTTWCGGGPGPIATIAAGSADASTGAGSNWRARMNSTGGLLPFGIEPSSGPGVDGPLDLIPLHGSIKMGATSGLCIISWGQNTPATASTTVREGSYLKVDMTSEYTL